MPPILIKDRNDRRAERRHKVSFRVRWAPGGAPESEGEVTDLSAGGCFVESEQAMREGDLVRLRIDVPGHGNLTIWGNVVYRVRDTGFGVRFAAFSQGGARDKLESFLTEQAG